MNQVVTNKIANTLLEQITSVISARRNADSTISEMRRIDLTPSDITYNKSVFYYNSGTMSDGRYIRLQEKEIYFKFQVNFSLLEENEKSFIRNAYDRSELEKPSIVVYCNGYIRQHNYLPPDDVLK